MSVDVGTRWYKAPEILYGARSYDASVDVWSAGCILAELLDTTPLFTGFNDFDQTAKIAFYLGSPDPVKDAQFFNLFP
jgi:serine/threonine protein kinase